MTRILVAEDNAADRMLLSRIVQREGYEVVTAVDGLDAVAKFADYAPDVVLLDAMMPEMDGFEVARLVKSQAKDRFVPIVFLSSFNESEWLNQCIEAGADDFLAKPYNPVLLKAKLQALEQMQRQQQTLRIQHEQLSRLHAHTLQEQMAAKSIFDNIAHTGKLRGPYLKHLLSPMSVFNGDVLLAAHDPAGDLLVLLGDFTGHGLTAAIGALPLADIFYGMTAKGFAVSDILREANRKLKLVLPPGYFCCATIIRLSFRKGTMEYWNGGLPGGVLLRRDRSATFELRSKHLPLGILDDASFIAQTEMVEVEFGDRLLMCTDGLIEAPDPDGEQFGYEQMVAVVQAADGNAVFETVLSAVQRHMANQEATDDLTLVEVAVLDLGEDSDQAALRRGHTGASQDWKFTYELGPQSLRVFNPIPLLQHILMETPQLRSHASEIYTVLAELYSNALEHGVMGLDSSMKDSAEGFSRYYEQRARALETLEGFIRFEFESGITATGGSLQIRVIDSGQGFDHQRLVARASRHNAGYHGRGVRLLNELCSSVMFEGCGNSVVVRFMWGDSA